MDQMTSLIQQIEKQDSQLEDKLKSKTELKSPGKKKKGASQNGKNLTPLPDRIKLKFEKLLDTNESQVADLEYTIGSKEDELKT